MIYRSDVFGVIYIEVLNTPVINEISITLAENGYLTPMVHVVHALKQQKQLQELDFRTSFPMI